MPEQKWTQANTGWPEAGRSYLQAAEAAYDQGASDGLKKVFPSYAAPSGWSEEDADRLAFVYAASWNANAIIGSAAKTQAEEDSAAVRRRVYKVETGRAITMGLKAGSLPLMPSYAPLDVWYDGQEISYLKALQKIFKDAYVIGRSFAYAGRDDTGVRRIARYKRRSR